MKCVCRFLWVVLCPFGIEGIVFSSWNAYWLYNKYFIVNGIVVFDLCVAVANNDESPVSMKLKKWLKTPTSEQDGGGGGCGGGSIIPSGGGGGGAVSTGAPHAHLNAAFDSSNTGNQPQIKQFEPTFACVQFQLFSVYYYYYFSSAYFSYTFSVSFFESSMTKTDYFILFYFFQHCFLRFALGLGRKLGQTGNP